jgi:hypothetical protein
MRAINESVYTICPDSGSTKRLVAKMRQVYRSQTDVLFDNGVEREIMRWARDPEKIQEIEEYLHNLADADGRFAKSVGTVESMIDTIMQFTMPEKASFQWNRHFRTAVEQVKDIYPKHLMPLDYRTERDVSMVISDWTTSAGWSGIIQGKPKKADLRDGALEVLKEKEKSALEVGSFNCPVIPGSRTQASGEFDDEGNMTHTFKRKKRPVWMTDFYQLLSEQRFARPLTQWLTHYEGSAIGKNDSEIQRQIFSTRLYSNWFISLDYSRYDSTIPSWLIREAFGILRGCFDLSDQMRELFSVVEEDFINKNILMDDGSFLHVTHGNPSGSAFTAIVNGICNELITRTWTNAMGHKRPRYIIMGDDNLIYLNEKVDVATIASYIDHNFGIKVNVDKTSVGSRYEYPEFLSRVWRTDGPWRHPNHLIAMLLYPERWRNHPDERSVQTVIYSYILGYPSAMRELLDVDGFLLATGLAPSNFYTNRGLIYNVPYNVRLAIEEGQYTQRLAEQLVA